MAAAVAKAVDVLLAATTADARKAAATDVTLGSLAAGISSIGETISKLKVAAVDKKSAGVREGAAWGFGALAAAFGQAGAPYLLPHLSVVTTLASDAASVKAAAETAATALMGTLNPNGVRYAAPLLFEATASKYKWQSRVLALSLVGSLAKIAPGQTTRALPDLIPRLSEFMGDARAEVSKAAEDALLSVCSVVNNKDIEPFIPTLVSCIARPDEVTDCMFKLGATTFVQAVEPPTLAIIMPVLERGLKERAVAVKRKVAVIIENMCKLVEVPAYAAPFLPKLLPGLDRAKEEVSDPECREVCAKAYKQLIKAAGADNAVSGVSGVVIAAADPAVLMGHLTDSLTASSFELPKNDEIVKPALDYIVSLACLLYDSNEFEIRDWTRAVQPSLGALFPGKDLMDLCNGYMQRCYRNIDGGAKEEDDDQGELLCDCEFSLAYAAKILLNQTRMVLRRGQRYGVCGHNGCGKSTLMRAIANGQVENFPSPDVVRTVYVEHDIQADQTELTVFEFVQTDKRLSDGPEIRRVLKELFFTDDMVDGPITALSGGWKMKLSLARAMLLKADIMLLDEPTNHLDKINVAWLKQYLKNLTNVTCMIVSHDAGFLDDVCTHIIHYENFKLKRYKGNLSEFVKKVPEARSYYELSATPIEFKFPEPGMLEGITSKSKAILKMMNVGYKYPKTERMVITGVTINCALASRVVVVGANGAGKSTMIKVLTGETVATVGTVWKHPNLRVAYVAQHAFHHMEKHLDKSPSEYIQWRYASGEDKEALDKEAAAITEEEEKKMAEKVTIDGQKFVVEQVLGRRKLKNSWEYDVKFVGLPIDKNQWLPRKWLDDNGFGKMVDALDAREAAMAGLHAKPLTAQNISKHLAEVGLPPEFSLHSRMRGLSGGQKVKVVLGAAMWNNPHMLVLDEPTNYLDRDSLGAFAAAIKPFGGGVIMITHNAEFANAICTETWLVANGRLNVSGESWTKDEKVKEQEAATEFTDAAGNVFKVKEKVKISKADMKKRIKLRLKKAAAGGELSDVEEWMDEIAKEMGVENPV